MAAIDALVLGTYFVGILAVGFWAGRGERDSEDFFLGGRNQHWLVVGLSILATELSAITFIVVPGTAYHGDWSYLQLYVGAFIGKLVIVQLLLPAFYGARVTTVYEFLGQRFGPWTRTTASLLFFASRIVGSALRLLAAAIAISIVFDWPLVTVIVGCAVVAMAYATFGGIKAIVWTDALQAVVFLVSATAALVYLFVTTPGSVVENLQFAHDAGKLRVFDWSLNLNDESAFVVLFVHTLFLNAAVFGTDQDMTQRMLTCRDIKQGQRSLMFNMFIGLPVVCLFLLVGVMLWVHDAANGTASVTEAMNANVVFPHFIANGLPAGVGLRGLLLSGLFAAAMSSLDSALGALSSSAVVDFYRPYFAPKRSERHYLRVARLFTVAFGLILVAVAIGFIGSNNLLWAVFEWAGLFFGALLGVFLLGVTTRTRGSDRFNVLAMLSAIAIVGALKLWQDPNAPIVAWPWWIVIGTVWTFAVGGLFRSGDIVGDAAGV